MSTAMSPAEPPAHLVRYLFGRLTVIAKYDNKLAFFREGVETRHVISVRGFGWGFAEIQTVKAERGLFLTGLLVKYRDITEEVYDPSTHELGGAVVENEVIAKARFFLHVESGLMAYRPIPALISDSAFRSTFKQIFESAYQNFFVDVAIQSIDEPSEFFEQLRRLQVVQRLVITLHPSNPRNAELWRRTDERLQALGASTYREEVTSKKDKGLDIERDEEAKSKIAMAMDGYGRADVKGLEDGRTRLISTERMPLGATAPDDGESPDRILKGLGPSMSEIFDRIK